MISNKTLAAFFAALDEIVNDDACFSDKRQRVLDYAVRAPLDDAVNLDAFLSWFDDEESVSMSF